MGKKDIGYQHKEESEMKENSKRATIVAAVAAVVLMAIASSVWALPGDLLQTFQNPSGRDLMGLRQSG